MTKKHLVVKDNVLIEASYNLDVVEQRLILLAIIEARETGKGISDDTLLEVHASSYIRHFDVEKNTAYKVLKSAAQTIFNRYVSYYDINPNTGKKRVFNVRWVDKVGYEVESGLVFLRFSQEVVPLITKLEANFTYYEVQQISKLNSAYAIRLYELLIKWRSVGKTPFLAMTEFRAQLGVEPNEYSSIGNFKARVLDHSITQINTHTDITVTYEQHKSGRIITGFSFTFNVKNKQFEPKKVKKETVNQTDSKIKVTANNKTDKIAKQFITLNPEQQTLIINHIKTQLSGLKKSKFNIEWDTFKAVGSQTMFEEFYENFAKALALLNIK